MRINFDFADLEAFIAVAASGSFQLASEKLNVSQSAITRRVQKLEASLGVSLFDRSTRSVKLTLTGKRLQLRAQAMIDDAVETALSLGDDSARFEYQRNAIVTVALVPSIIYNILPQAIKQFRNAGHSARIRVVDRLAYDVTESVAQGEADFGISSISAFEPDMSFETLVDDRIILCLHKDDPLAGRNEISWQELTRPDFIIPMKGTGNRMLIDEAMARSRQSPNWSYEVRRTATALEMVKAGIGVAALPQSAVPKTANSEIKALPLVSPSVGRSIGIVLRNTPKLSSPASAFLLDLKQAIIANSPGAHVKLST
jgi:DNA-binding transcriptional LysR family regulator